ncbi:type IV pilus assembly protein PilZ [Treponema socranskii subsp. socranskii VPI DR56BR1116 = ATCC 35536]|uniref:Type IV pilus assembly protein PilZ n=1 Tax=Treponema socranskii subsp. socranskii VPI DR56BR1116 = ATCC 35536 TaxID=1125725 RepID=U2N0U2_TRESO|nr:PilZ domain-containing protein [Treponema socranskii]ERF61057.1 type IV pilus assembly protein PilZ [Treponema socranskii subsp. socranskii VPI DR56BR1116 = ATCC 35536]ERK05034.1 type IV pilus assembly protein PilZ [Treponema socranskii subsp. socranskii VPI DR56BR1116 = ATCC 35536]
MYILKVTAAAVAAVIALKLAQTYQKKIKFFLTGFDSRFSLSEIDLLWRTAAVCGLKDPHSLFWSKPSLSQCISQIKSNAEKANDHGMQRLLAKLYSYRTHIEAEASQKRGLTSTRALESALRLRIVLAGKGVFASKIVNNARELTISFPTQNGQMPVESKDWIGKSISVYLWRTGDARYIFDTTVIGSGIFFGKAVLYLKHTEKLLRTQKRYAVRTKCNMYASLFIIKDKVIDYNLVETQSGYRCLIEDISESGAMVRIGGKGVPNIQLKLQFTLEGKLIIMFGVVRTVEYNSDIDQSRLHFECVHIEPQMKNQILSFVYNIMSPEERRAYELFPVDEDAEDSEDEAPQADGTGEEPAEEAGDAAFAYELSDTKIPDTTDALIDTMVGNG